MYYLTPACTPLMHGAHPKLVLQVLWFSVSGPQLLNSNGTTEYLQWNGDRGNTGTFYMQECMLTFHWLDKMTVLGAIYC